MERTVIAVVVVLSLAVSAVVALSLCSPALASDEGAAFDLDDLRAIDELSAAVVTLQPWYRKRPTRATRLARVFFESGREYDVDSLLGLAMAFCESSLVPAVIDGRIRGARGEMGVFQIMPDSYPAKRCGRGRDLLSLDGNVAAGFCYLSHLRELCDSDDVWVMATAYGRASCPSPRGARRARFAKRRRETLCTIAGQQKCAVIWPL